MTPDELERIKRYADRLTAADGDIACLTVEESHDLERLLRKRLQDTEEEPPPPGH